MHRSVGLVQKMISNDKLINYICGLACITPEDVFASFGAISPTYPSYSYLNGILTKTNGLALVYLLDNTLVVDIPGWDINGVACQVSLLEQALRQLENEQLDKLRSVWVARLIESGYGDRLKDFYL